jgi:hypothetical protein
MVNILDYIREEKPEVYERTKSVVFLPLLAASFI